MWSMDIVAKIWKGRILHFDNQSTEQQTLPVVQYSEQLLHQEE